MRTNFKFKIAAVLGLLAILIGLTGCANNNSNKITVVGSSAMQLLAEQAGNDYRLSHPDSNIVVQGGGSGTGLSQVQAGAVEIGTSDVFAETQKGIDAKKLQNHLVAVVGIVPIVSKSAGVKNLTRQQLSDIFTGKITNWKQVGGKNQNITVINRSKGSGTRGTFEGLILNGKKPIQAQEQDSNGTVRKIVSSTPGTISYISF
ncbi:MAG: substrate-binding domain-containing protein, partial [Lactobacillus paragasseri]